MQPKNENICISGEEALEVLSEIELVLISLRRIGDAYLDGGPEYERETTRFIDEWQVTSRLANARRILTQRFDLTRGPDDMDDIERAMEATPYWRSAETQAPKG